MLRRGFLLLISCSLLMTGCKKSDFSQSGRLICIEGLHDISYTLTHVETDKEYAIPISENGDYVIEDIPVGTYRVEVMAYDETGTFLKHYSDREVVLPLSRNSNLPAVSNEMEWSSSSIEARNDGYHLLLMGPRALCDWGMGVRVYVSDQDPMTFDDPNDLFTEQYEVYNNMVEFEEEVDIFLDKPGKYYAFQWGQGSRWTRTLPESFLVEDVPKHTIRQGENQSIQVFEDEPTWITAYIPEGRLCVMEYFDVSSIGQGGRNLLMSAYSPDMSVTYFERRPLQPEDGAPPAVWPAHGEDFLFKAEVDETGTAGSFRLFSSYTLDAPTPGIEATVRLDDFYGSYKHFTQDLAPGEYTFSSFESNPENRAIKFWLFNTTTGETILQDISPSEDSASMTDHAFSLDEQSEVRLVVTKAYWGDYDNVVKFFLD